MAKKRFLLAQMGTPCSPKVSDVRHFLFLFLSDPKVVGLPWFFWKFFLKCFLLPLYSAKSAKLYERLWDGEMFMSKRKTCELALSLKQKINNESEYANAELETFFSYSDHKLNNNQNPNVLILFPQYCESTYGVIKKELEKKYLNFETYPPYYNQNFYINACVQHIDEALGAARVKGHLIQKLILSFHSMPLKQIKKWDDPYLAQCQETYKLIKERVKEIEKKDIHIAFQSRFGPGKWATPETKEFAIECLKKDHKEIAIFCPGFIVDGIETVDEIGRRLSDEMKSLGGELFFIPCLNARDDFVSGLADYILKSHLK